jgi:hypothetical protein
MRTRIFIFLLTAAFSGMAHPEEPLTFSVVDEDENLMKLRALHSFVLSHKARLGRLPSSLEEMQKHLHHRDDEGAFYKAQFYENPENNKFEEWLVSPPNTKGYLIMSRVFEFPDTGTRLIYVLFKDGTARRLLAQDVEGAEKPKGATSPGRGND